MNDTHSINIFKTHHRYLRSANLERDWNDPAALENYVFTPQAQQSLMKFSLGLRHLSSLRAWRVTGDYGSGKSLFSLLLANLFDKRKEGLSQDLQEFVKKSNPLFLSPDQPKLVPILITGTRGALGFSILQALLRYMQTEEVTNVLCLELAEIITSGGIIADDVVVDWVKKFNQYVIRSNRAAGAAIIIDEAGKFLEFAAANPDHQDIYLLQSLAEMASRSGKNPLFVITIFHQGIASYAERLSKTQQREWDKVAGRYEEIIWHFPMDQIVTLIAHALDPDPDFISQEQLKEAKANMRQALELGWYGINVDFTSLLNLAGKLYPIHSTVIPVLVKLFSNFGQNERSLYSFLLGAEDFGLQEFVSKTNGKDFFQLHHLYDYARATFGSRLASLSYYWKAIDDVVSSYVGNDTESLELLKTIGIINLINSDALIPSRKIILLATVERYADKLSELQNKHIIHFRGHAGGYCVWPHSSINLEDSYATAIATLGSLNEIKALIRDQLATRPIVARRHYIEKGNLRYFEIKYVEINELANEAAQSFNGDGLILVPLCETASDAKKAHKIAASEEFATDLRVLIVVPTPLQELSVFLEEVRRWEWIGRSVGELRQDRFAREEVSRQLSAAKLELQRHLQTAIGLTSFTTESNLSWYHKGGLVESLTTSKKVMSLLSDIFDAVYTKSPSIHNELVNRRELSSAAASARLRLCERLFEYSGKPFLDMDPVKHPPEMSMYLSVLQEAGLHQYNAVENTWHVGLPDPAYDGTHCNIRPSMERIHDLLASLQDQRVSVIGIIQALKAAPYGVREGMIPLLLAVFAVMNEQAIAFYEDGSFIPRISGSNYLRLIKAPETFEIQYYPISAVRASLFEKLVEELGFEKGKRSRIDLLDVIKPLFIFISGLPEYVSNSSSLSPQTQRIRNILRTTKDPVKLLFKDLPLACETKIIAEDKTPDQRAIDKFAENLKFSIDELRASYPLLLENLQKELIKEFGLSGTFESCRSALAQRAKSLAGFVTEIRLKSYCLRLADTNLSIGLWTESLSNLICSMPAAKWRDKDLYKYEQEIHKLTQQFLRVEATLYNQTEKQIDGISVRVALTRPNGQERDQVIHLSPAQTEKVEELEGEIEAILLKHGQLGIAAASGVLWKMMTGENDPIE